ncbi:urease subunit alpha, partial [Streptomyces sp. NPDC001571]
MGRSGGSAVNSSVDPTAYAAVHGPRAGDRVRLGDSGLTVRVESDSQAPGDEFLAGFGKTAR